MIEIIVSSNHKQTVSEFIDSGIKEVIPEFFLKKFIKCDSDTLFVKDKFFELPRFDTNDVKKF